jgi:ethanolamine utilization protein EutN
MQLGRVIGTVVATIRCEELSVGRLTLVQPVDEHGHARGNPLVAVDPVCGAGEGLLVCYVTGSDASRAVPTSGQPVDAAIVSLLRETQA